MNSSQEMASPVCFHRLYINSLRGSFLRSQIYTPKIARPFHLFPLTRPVRPQTIVPTFPILPLALPQSVVSQAPKASIVQFLSNKVWQATHRSHNTQSSRARDPFRPPRPPKGPWQQLKDRIEAVPSNVIFWSVLVLNGIVFGAWQFGWAKYVS